MRHCHRKQCGLFFLFQIEMWLTQMWNKCKRQVSRGYVHKWIYFFYHFTQYFFHFSCCYLSWSEKLFFYSLKPFCQSLTSYPGVKRLTYVEASWACYDKIESRKGRKKDFIIFRMTESRFHSSRREVISDEEYLRCTYSEFKVSLQRWQPPTTKEIQSELYLKYWNAREKIS